MWHKIFGFNKVLSFVFYIKDILISLADGKESAHSFAPPYIQCYSYMRNIRRHIDFFFFLAVF
jgi:hypothetical protein